MSNNNDNNKQPLDLTESLLVFDKVQAPSTTRVQSAEASTTTPTVNKLDYDGISLVERRSRDVKPREKNDSLGISGINQPDVTIGILLDCAKRGENLGNQPSPSICKVSRILRDHNESSFTPQLVSIGPIHREDPKLQELEKQKERYLNDLLSRCYSDPMPKEKILEECLLKVNTLLPQIRESYAGVIENCSDDDLARMMVMDGCFILEFFFKHEQEDEYLPNKMQNLRIAMDLMLLENQVPFIVLQALFDCSMGKRSFTLSQVVDNYLAPYVQLFLSLLPEKFSTTDSTHDHVLGYLHKRYQLVAAKSSMSIDKAAFHSIVELDRSGIKFKIHQEDGWSMTIKFQSSLFACLPWFWIKPTLLMPPLLIDDFTELILRNFIAYEQSFPQGRRRHVSAYAKAMSRVINTQEDIAKLVESKVLVNMLGSNQEAADMINKICKNIPITDFYYTKEFKQMDKYYNGFFPKIKRIYFSNPWNSINLLAGIIVFLATVVGGIFAVLQYFG